METTRSSFQQMIDCRIFLAFLFLFTQSVTVQSADFPTSITSTTSATTLAAILVPTTSATTLAASFVPTTSATTLATKKGNEATKKGNEAIAKSITSGDLVMNTVSASESTSIPSTKHSLGLSSSLPSKQPPVVTQVATTHGKKLSALDVATTTVSNATKEPGPKLTTDTLGLNITAKQKTVETQMGATTFSGTNITTTISDATTVVQKIHLTSGVLTTSNEIISTPKSLRPRSKGRPGESTGKGLITTTWIDVSESTPTPAVSHDRETLSTDPEEITATAPSSPQGKNTVLIVAIVLFFLLLLVLVVACLFCRRRHRSGSTSAAGWAGQAALPDDTGLDKDVEQGLSGSGERETRRATLTTFFGKRQSRVASIAMEEIDEKEKEEAQRMIDGDAGRESSVQGSGEANGKVPESTQETIPPTQVE